MQKLNPFASLRVVHNILAGGLVLFSAIVFFINRQNPVEAGSDTVFDRNLQVIVVLIAGVAGIAGFRLFKKRLIAVHQSTGNAEQKMNSYRKACFTWWAMLEAPALFSLVSFWLTGNYAFIFLAIFLIVVLALFMPRKDNIVLLLKLDSKDVERLESTH